MPYLGKSPSQGVRTRFQFTPNAGTTSISGADANGLTLSFTDGNYVDVYLNGVMLKAGVDYNTNTANTIAGLSATVASDVVDIVVYDTFSLFGGTLEGNVKVNNGTFNVTGAGDFDSTLNVDGVVTANAGVVVDNITIDGTEIDLSSGNLTIDVANDIILDSGDGDIQLKDTGSTFLNIYESSDHAYLYNPRSNGDIIFQGNGVSEALRLDMSASGAATFNGTITGTTATLVGANTLTLRNDTSTDVNEPKLIFDNDTFSGANYANITTGNGGLLLKIESPSTSTFQNRHQIIMNGGAGDDIQFNLSTDNGSNYVNYFKIDGGNATFNETGADKDFRIESDSNANMFQVDGGNNRVSIGGVNTLFNSTATVTRNDTASLGDFEGNLMLFDNSGSSTATNGGHLLFSGHDGTSVRGFAKILGVKETQLVVNMMVS